MQTLLATFILVALAMLAMALGVILSGKRLRGSCGGDPAGKDCSCSLPKRKACEARAADADFDKPEGRHHLNMLD